ncbi:CHAT domain-containing protein [Mycena epipterygia]|nr:CHAT domain-containing protein [Mycena epipterygia]
MDGNPTPLSAPSGSTSVVDRANSLFKDCLAECNITDLDTAIYLLAQAVNLRAGESMLHSSECLELLASACLTRFSHTAQWDDVPRAAFIHYQLLRCRLIDKTISSSMYLPEYNKFPDDSADIEDNPSGIVDLAATICGIFHAAINVSTLNTAIAVYHEAISANDLLGSEKLRTMRHLANALLILFRLTKNSNDLEEAISLLRELSVAQPNNISCLCAALLAEPNGRNASEAISSVREAFKLDIEALMMRRTGMNFLKAFSESKHDSDLDMAVSTLKDAALKLTWGDSHYADIMSMLGDAHLARFQHRRDAEDIDIAISLHREAMAEMAVYHSPDRAILLVNLASALFECFFDAGGGSADLDSAIQLYSEALDLWPASHPLHTPTRGRLGLALWIRSRITQDMAEMDRGVELIREATDLLPRLELEYHRRVLINLGPMVGLYLWKPGNVPNLDSAINLGLQALPDQSPSLERALSLSRVAHMLQERFDLTGDLADLDHAIKLYRGTLDAILPARHPSRGLVLLNLSDVLYTRFKSVGERVNLDMAIEVLRDALDIFQPPHTFRAHTLPRISSVLAEKYAECPESETLEEWVNVCRDGAKDLSSNIFQRFSTSTRWALFAETQAHSSALEGFEISVGLLPQLAMLGWDIQTRQKVLITKNNVGLASNAAACACQLNQNEKAVEFLEAGRSIFWSQGLQLHTPLNDVRSAHPSLAQHISEIAKNLAQGAYRPMSHEQILEPEILQQTVFDDEVIHYQMLNAQWVRALHDVRCLPGLERFLQPKMYEELRKAARNGPVVILTAPRFSRFNPRGHALIVTSSGDIERLHLDQMPWKVAEAMAKLFTAALSGSEVTISQLLAKRETADGSTSVEARLLGKLEGSHGMDCAVILEILLERLWKWLVQPIFDALKLQKSGKPSRLWWCPTGPFAFLPIHAAGVYKEGYVSDYVVSSYTPTLTALLNQPEQTFSPFNMTALIQPKTPGCSPLPATTEELRRIQQIVPKEWLTSLGNTDNMPATVQATLSHLPKSAIVHFACHGEQDPENPLDSGLFLADGRLKVSEVMRVKGDLESNGSHMALAFLGACKTATGDEAVPDEAMHLAATMLFTGFHGVVATMWQMHDPDGPEIAETFYRHLFKGCDAAADPPILPDLTKSAEALHIAVKKLREDPNVPVSRWAPFVHYGL